MSITNIVAIAMLSGSPQCPPPVDTNDVANTAQIAMPMDRQDQTARNTAQNAAVAVARPPETSATTLSAPGQVEANASSPSEVSPPQPTSAETAADEASPAVPEVVDQSTIIVTANLGPPPGDPAEVVNEVAFGAVQAVDEAVIAPVANGYKNALPEPIRDGIHNVLNNLDEPIVFVNFLLQLKIGKAVETVGRFAINSTVGVAGLFDVAKKKPFNLPRRSNGLADTLGYYGVGPGPYLFLPLVGSTTVRDLLGRVVDLSLVPTAVGRPFTNPLVSTTKGILSSVDERVRNDEILTRIQKSGNPYAAMREYYLKTRQAEIDVLRGKRCNADINLSDLEFMDSLPAATTKPVVQSSAPQSK